MWVCVCVSVCACVYVSFIVHSTCIHTGIYTSAASVVRIISEHERLAISWFLSEFYEEKKSLRFFSGKISINSSTW